MRRGALRVAYLRVLASGGHSGLASFTVIGPAIFWSFQFGFAVRFTQVLAWRIGSCMPSGDQDFAKDCMSTAGSDSLVSGPASLATGSCTTRTVK